MATANAKTDFLEQKVIEAVLKNTPITAWSSTWVALLTAVTTPESGTVTEVTLGSYARQEMVSASAWSAGGQVADAYEVSNAADIAFPVATADYDAAVTHFGLYDASTSGNLLYWGALDTPRTVLTNDQFKFLAGNLKISES